MLMGLKGLEEMQDWHMGWKLSHFNPQTSVMNLTAHHQQRWTMISMLTPNGHSSTFFVCYPIVVSSWRLCSSLLNTCFSSQLASLVIRHQITFPRREKVHGSDKRSLWGMLFEWFWSRSAWRSDKIVPVSLILRLISHCFWHVNHPTQRLLPSFKVFSDVFTSPALCHSTLRMYPNSAKHPQSLCGENTL